MTTVERQLSKHTHTQDTHTHTHAHEHGIEETHRTQNTERSRMRKDQDGSSRTGKPDEMSLNTYGVHEKNGNRHTQNCTKTEQNKMSAPKPLKH